MFCDRGIRPPLLIPSTSFDDACQPILSDPHHLDYISLMHQLWEIDEIVRAIVARLGRQKGAVALACSSKSLSDIVLDSLWERLMGLSRLLKCLPPDSWDLRDFDFVRATFAVLLTIGEAHDLTRCSYVAPPPKNGFGS